MSPPNPSYAQQTGIALSPEQIKTAPTEQLARVVLQALTRSGPDRISLHNWGVYLIKQYGKDAELFGALGEAVAWLQAQVFLVPDLIQAGTDDMGLRLSRSGSSWLQAGDGRPA